MSMLKMPITEEELGALEYVLEQYIESEIELIGDTNHNNLDEDEIRERCERFNLIITIGELNRMVHRYTEEDIARLCETEQDVYDPAEYWNEIHKHKPPTPKLTDVRIDEEDGTYIVVPVFAGLDRPDSSQYWCGKKENLARRLRDAIYAGVVLEDITHKIDINGRSYASFGMNVRMRCLNADLKKLGY